jgi:hypothetical protein
MRLTKIVAYGIALFGIVAVGPGAAPAAASDGKLVTAAQQMANELAIYLKERAQVDEVAVESFTNDQLERGSSLGQQIKLLLVEELAKLNIRQNKGRDARFSCKGTFTFDPNTQKVLIEAILREGRFPRTNCSTEIFDVSDILKLMGGTGKLSPAPEKRADDLRDLIEKPAPIIVPSPFALEKDKNISGRAFPRSDAVYAMEIWRLKANRIGTRNPVEDDYELVSIEQKNGLLNADLELENIYAIRLINNTEQLAAATLTIDGINMFAFSKTPGYKRLGKVLVPPGPKGVLIKGWHVTNGQSFSFKVSDVGEAAIVELRGAGPEVEENVGVIPCSFAPAADLSKNEGLPPDEPKSASIATSRGPEIGAEYREVQVKIGLDREVISIRYSRGLPL